MPDSPSRRLRAFRQGPGFDWWRRDAHEFHDLGFKCFSQALQQFHSGVLKSPFQPSGIRASYRRISSKRLLRKRAFKAEATQVSANDHADIHARTA